jgi:uncharacterized repeat protein (TIGR01451 family)
VKFTLLTRIVVPVVAFLTVLGIFSGSTTPTYASHPAAITPSAEPATRTPPPVPSSTMEVRPSITPEPQPSNTPEPEPSPQPTNTRPRDVEGERKGVSIWIRKELVTANPQVGQELEFRLVVNNNGDLTAQDVVISDPLPSWLRLVSATSTRGTVNTDNNTVTVDVGPVGAGDTVYVTIIAQLSENPPAGANTNTATVRTSSNDDDRDNRSTVTIPRIGGDVESDQGQVTRTPVMELTATALAEVTPEPTLEATLGPVPPTATPAVPARLPTTSDNGGSTMIGLFAAIACLSLMLGLALRRQGRTRA